MPLIGLRSYSLSDVTEMISDRFSSHEPVVIPTDTIYGLASPYDDELAVEKIYEIKGRPSGKPLAVCISGIGWISKFAHPSEGALDIIRRTAPGPFTYILPAASGLPGNLLKDGKVALRIPDNDFILALSDRLGPMALTSANISGEEGADGADKVMHDLHDHDLLIVEDDKALSGHASEVVDLTGGGPKVFRGGKIKIDEMMREV
ncbi:MAG: L-threonylcarbamoyladenylate synthase [Thermoplasmatota archaeon]